MRGFGWVGGVAVGVGGWVRGWLGVVVAMITGVGHACVCGLLIGRGALEI